MGSRLAKVAAQNTGKTGMNNSAQPEYPDWLGALATRIAESERNRPGELDTGQGDKTAEANPKAVSAKGRQSPEQAALYIMKGVEENEVWILTHPEMKSLVENRTASLLSAFDRESARREG